VSRQLTHALVIGIVMASTVTSAARSQNLLEQLVTPGPVVAGHATPQSNARDHAGNRARLDSCDGRRHHAGSVIHHVGN
jgi:hypothetical protein